MSGDGRLWVVMTVGEWWFHSFTIQIIKRVNYQRAYIIVLGRKGQTQSTEPAERVHPRRCPARCLIVEVPIVAYVRASENRPTSIDAADASEGRAGALIATVLRNGFLRRLLVSGTPHPIRGPARTSRPLALHMIHLLSDYAIEVKRVFPKDEGHDDLYSKEERL